MKLWSHYHVVQSVNEAIALLTRYQGQAQIVAGGTDLLLDIQQGHHPPAEALIDITRIPELLDISSETVDGRERLILGAGVTHTGFVASPVIRSRATLLAESCGVIGGPQVRNVATIGGNVAHALPAADGTLSLVALRAEAEVASREGRHWLPILDLFAGPGQSRIDPTSEVLTRFRFNLTEVGEGSAFRRIMRPQGVALPILGCAVWVKLNPARTEFADASICIGPVGPTPARATTIESALIGQEPSEAVIADVARLARKQLSPRTSKYRATASYRTEMIELLLQQALSSALSRALSGEAIPEGIG